MDVRAAHLPQVPALGGVHRRLDVTVSDGGVHQLPNTESSPAAAPAQTVEQAAEPTSSPELSVSLSAAEKGALTERFAALPRQGVTGSGVYDPRGRTPRPPVQAQQGRVLDVTG